MMLHAPIKPMLVRRAVHSLLAVTSSHVWIRQEDVSNASRVCVLCIVCAVLQFCSSVGTAVAASQHLRAVWGDRIGLDTCSI